MREKKFVWTKSTVIGLVFLLVVGFVIGAISTLVTELLFSKPPKTPTALPVPTKLYKLTVNTDDGLYRCETVTISCYNQENDHRWIFGESKLEWYREEVESE